jgi:chromosome partitioning protein
MRVICIAIPKGGEGKTTTAVNLAASLAAAEKKTLLIDADTLGASGISLGYTADQIKYGLYDVFNYTHSLNRVIYKTELTYLDFIPSNISTVQMEERLLRLSENRTIMKIALRDVEKNYDYVIIDCPPMLRGITTNALCASNSVVIPMRASHFSLDAVMRLMRYMKWIREVANPKIYVEGILLTMYEPNTKISEITGRELRSRYSKFLFKIVIPKNSTLAEAAFYGRPVLLYNINSKGAQAYFELATEIISREQAFKEMMGESASPSSSDAGESENKNGASQDSQSTHDAGPLEGSVK